MLKIRWFARRGSARPSFTRTFDFDCWDMDFCRQADSKGITLGTVPVGVQHESAGRFRAEAWVHAFKRYIEKWGD